jgi:hypothetical protein
MSSHCLGLGAHSAGKSIVFKSRQLAVGEGPGAMSVQNQLNGRPDGASCCRENNEERRALSSLTHTQPRIESELALGELWQSEIS